MYAIILFCLVSVIAGTPASIDFLKRADLLRAEKKRMICTAKFYAEPYELSYSTPFPDYYRWPGGIIPYDFDPELKEDASQASLRNLIRKAMREIESETDNCVKFVSRRKSRDADWVRIFRGDRCESCVGKQHFSKVGMQLFGKDNEPQLLSIGHGCDNLQIIMHELLHTAGMTHEHQRPDRDDYIIINEACLGKNDPRKNYDKLTPRQITCFTPFDYNSIMLYGGKQKNGVTCITDLDGNELTPVYEKDGMSDADIKRIKILYGCDGEKDTMSKKLCQQEPV